MDVVRERMRKSGTGERCCKIGVQGRGLDATLFDCQVPKERKNGRGSHVSKCWARKRQDEMKSKESLKRRTVHPIATGTLGNPL